MNKKFLVLPILLFSPIFTQVALSKIQIDFFKARSRTQFLKPRSGLKTSTTLVQESSNVQDNSNNVRKSEEAAISENTVTIQELQKLNSETKSDNQLILGLWQNVFQEVETANSLVGLAFGGTGRSNEGSLTTITQGSSCKSIFNSQSRYNIKRKSSTAFYTAIDIDKGFTTTKTIFRIEKESGGKYLYIQLKEAEEERPKAFDKNVTKLVIVPGIDPCNASQ